MLNQQFQNNFRVAIAMSIVAFFAGGLRINPENHLECCSIINVNLPISSLCKRSFHFETKGVFYVKE
jgi:hypothetical protein